MDTFDEQQDAAPWEEFSKTPDQMDESSSNNVSGADDDGPLSPDKAELANEIAMEYAGFWNRLVSQTNWEKGKVIFTWRTRLIEAGLPRRVWTDDSIADQIGNVSGQHVGRLRRVYERFGDSERLTNLFWSHYQAALDWDDADVWLKKADDEGLSVAAMRIARWEKYGAPASKKPKEEEIVTAEPDEDVNPHNDSQADFIEINNDFGKEAQEGKTEDQADSDSEKHSKKENDKSSDEPAASASLGDDLDENAAVQATSVVLNALNKLPQLPEDLGDAFEMLKISLLNHKLSNWDLVAPETVLAYLAALKALVLSTDSK